MGAASKASFRERFLLEESAAVLLAQEKQVPRFARNDSSARPAVGYTKHIGAWVGDGTSRVRVSHGRALQYDAEECARDCRTGDGEQDVDVSRGAEADGGDDSRVSGEDEVSRGVGHEWRGCGFDRESAADGSGAAVVPDDDHGDHQHGASDGDAGDDDLRSDIDGPRNG